MIGTMTGIRVDLNEGVEVSMQGKICNALRQMSERARAEGLEQGIEQGKDLNAINNIKNIMKSLNCDVDKAMELVGTPEDKKEEYKNRIESES